MIKKTLVSLVALTGFIGVAAAADLPARMPVKAAPMAAPVYAWTGFYLGVNGGYGWARTNHTDTTGLTTGNFNQSGGLVGGTAGYNWQTGATVFGIETDLDWAHLDGSASPCAFGSCFTTLQSLGTLRGRIGYAINNWMPFISGGLAYADVKAGQDGVGGASVDNWRTGWTLGGGVEWMFVPRWSAKLEYLHAGFGGTAVTYTPTGAGAIPVNVTERNVDVVRAGVNYHF